MDNPEYRRTLSIPEGCIEPIPSDIDYQDGYHLTHGQECYWQEMCAKSRVAKSEETPLVVRQKAKRKSSWFGLGGTVTNNDLELSENLRPKGWLLYLHGYGGHFNSWIRDHALEFVKAGYLVSCMDYPGHGKSTGVFGLVESFETTMLCVKEFIMWRRTESPHYHDLPFFVVGESMGGCAAATLYHDHLKNSDVKVSGVIMIAPMCGVVDPPNPVLRVLLETFSLIFPEQQWVPTKEIANFSLKDEELRDRAQSNPLTFHEAIRNRTARELLTASERMRDIARGMDVPLLIIHGAEDVVTSPEESRIFHDLAATDDKKYISCEGGWHSLLTADDPILMQKRFGELISWTDSHCKKYEEDTIE